MANLIKGGQTTQWPTLYRTYNTMANLIKGGQTTQWPTLYRTDNTMANLIKGGQTTQWPTLYRTDNTMASLTKGGQTTQWPTLSTISYCTCGYRNIRPHVHCCNIVICTCMIYVLWILASPLK